MSLEKYNCPHCKKPFASEPGNNTVILCPSCNGVVMLPSCDFKTGDMVGGFEIISLLGKGGMGNVYLAKQKSMQRLVALKTISSTFFSDPMIKEQFASEVQISGRLNHPNIITAIDAGEDNGIYYLAVNYIDGEDYERRLNREFAISEKEALQIAMTLADALKYAWDKHRLLHKDIKPGNIIKDKKGEVHLMDLGIAQKIGKSSDSGKKMILGSPFYMSPEQARAEAGIDWKTDLYSLGATLYHMVVGVPPYDASDVNKIMMKHVESAFPEPVTRNPNSKISYHMVELIRKMMSKSPNDRHSSWEEFRAAAKKTALLISSQNSASLSKKINQSGKIPATGAVGKTASWSKTAVMPKKTTSIPTKGAASSAPIKTGSHISLINYALIIVTAIIVAFIIRSVVKNSNASKAIKYADEYSVRYPNNHEEILRLYIIAMESTKGTSHYADSVAKYNIAVQREDSHKKDKELFETRMREASRLYAAKDYKGALALLEELKKFEDPVLRETAMGTILNIENEMKSKGIK